MAKETKIYPKHEKLPVINYFCVAWDQQAFFVSMQEYLKGKRLKTISRQRMMAFHREGGNLHTFIYIPNTNSWRSMVGHKVEGAKLVIIGDNVDTKIGSAVNEIASRMQVAYSHLTSGAIRIPDPRSPKYKEMMALKVFGEIGT